MAWQWTWRVHAPRPAPSSTREGSSSGGTSSASVATAQRRSSIRRRPAGDLSTLDGRAGSARQGFERRPVRARRSRTAAAGLSLGEYSALVFAGSLEFEDALRTSGCAAGSCRRPATSGARWHPSSAPGRKRWRMSSKKPVRWLPGWGRQYNSPDQTVISARWARSSRPSSASAAAGARRAIRLKVAGGTHLTLMAPARKLEPHLQLPIRGAEGALLLECRGRGVATRRRSGEI